MALLVSYCALLVKGLESFGVRELNDKLAATDGVLDAKRAEFYFRSDASKERIRELRCVVDVFEVIDFAVPRPGSLKGEQHLRRLVSRVSARAEQVGAQCFRLEMAGKDSREMMKLRSLLAERTTLRDSSKDEDCLLLRLFPCKSKWRCLLRTSLRPLSTRSYRKRNFEGALNGVAAACLLKLFRLPAQAKILDLCCGSGTFLAEATSHSHFAPALFVGADNDAQTLSLCRENVGARAVICRADSRFTPFADGTFDACVANLPWGERLGERHSMKSLYHSILRSAARLVREGGEVLFVTQHSRAFNDAIAVAKLPLEGVSQGRYFQRGFWPHYFHLRRLPSMGATV